VKWAPIPVVPVSHKIITAAGGAGVRDGKIQLKEKRERGDLLKGRKRTERAKWWLEKGSIEKKRGLR